MRPSTRLSSDSLYPNSVRVNFHGGAEYNIDVREIFLIRIAEQSKTGVSFTYKNLTDHSNLWYAAAICDFYGLLHDYHPPSNQHRQYADIHERVTGYLEEKYLEQPRPQIAKPSKADRIENTYFAALQTPLYWLAWLLIIIWFGTLIMGHPLESLLILGGFFIAITTFLWLLTKLLGYP